jgi:hypothetical protein
LDANTQKFHNTYPFFGDISSPHNSGLISQSTDKPPRETANSINFGKYAFIRFPLATRNAPQKWLYVGNAYSLSFWFKATSTTHCRKQDVFGTYLRVEQCHQKWFFNNQFLAQLTNDGKWVYFQASMRRYFCFCYALFACQPFPELMYYCVL